jgi:hypothetical protein
VAARRFDSLSRLGAVAGEKRQHSWRDSVDAVYDGNVAATVIHGQHRLRRCMMHRFGERQRCHRILLPPRNEHRHFQFRKSVVQSIGSCCDSLQSTPHDPCILPRPSNEGFRQELRQLWRMRRDQAHQLIHLLGGLRCK